MTVLPCVYKYEYIGISHSLQIAITTLQGQTETVTLHYLVNYILPCNDLSQHQISNLVLPSGGYMVSYFTNMTTQFENTLYKAFLGEDAKVCIAHA